MIKTLSSSVASSTLLAFWEWVLFAVVFNQSTHLAGTYSLILALTAPLYLLLNSNIKILVLTAEDSSLRDIFSLRVFSSLLFVGISLFVYFFTGDIALVTLVILLKVANMYFDYCYAFDLKAERHTYLLMKVSVRIFAGVAALFVGIYMMNSLYYSLFLVILTNLLCIGYFEKSKIRYRSFSSLVDVSKFARFSIFAILIPLTDTLASNAPKYLLGLTDSLEVLAKYTAIFYLAQIAGVAVNGIANALLPRMTKLIFDGAYKHVVRLNVIYLIYILALSIVAFIFLQYFGYEILVLLYDESVGELTASLNILFVYTLLWVFSSLAATLLAAMKVFKVQSQALTTMLISNLIFLGLYYWNFNFDEDNLNHITIVQSLLVIMTCGVGLRLGILIFGVVKNLRNLIRNGKLTEQKEKLI